MPQPPAEAFFVSLLQFYLCCLNGIGMEKIAPQEVWHYMQEEKFSLFDVRSPAEYAHAHIPNAISLPLFTDEERAKVGTSYKQVSPQAALQLGLELVGPKMADFVRQAERQAPNRKLIVHCWRGGKRSGSMAWLLSFAGFEVKILTGGYKAYRQYLAQEFTQKKLKIIVLGGKTGSGKTAILQTLAQQGEQIIDLEALAHHKGSAFGWIGENSQNSSEQFENDLFIAFQKIDPNRRVWVENESRHIGSVFIHQGFWFQMKQAPLFHLEIPFQARVRHLVAVYTQTKAEDLIQSFEKIRKRLGHEATDKSIKAIEVGDFEAAAAIGLSYYDKTYDYSFETNPTLEKHVIPCTTLAITEIAHRLIAYADRLDY
jgi:tRNA 2-selenouridine synthase